ncbi:DUF262 and DUF1524 domain-containing protein [Paenibacillus massiliensis]|uniref:DUF262 and DUF1524 domain-containing protein n=1 Tax=Paenibacillus massiliensis TaxID=225917 RepID=UPI0004712DC1|nr:DUF262 and DUF1524 domain-containing protein [Paenibacillus massiliensis]
MKATETNFLRFLQGSKQFIIPIYQRKYSWTLRQCKQLWNDIMRAVEDENKKGHFIGSVVYIEKGIYQSSSVPQLLVIDGQQRMTTLTLLLLAWANASEKSDQIFDMTKRKVLNYFLVNNDEEGELYQKLILTKSDKDTLISLIAGKELPEEYSQKIYENYQFFFESISKSGMDLNKLYQGIQKLIVVDISLDRDHDNPQLIFESLNSTGLDLSQADLIRNFVLMKLEPKEQSELYNEYWYPMEKNFGDFNQATLFDRFVRDYLTIKTGRIPNIQEVYSTFKEYVYQNNNFSVVQIVQDIYRYSKYFVKIAFQTEKNKVINQALVDIDSLKVDVSYPFLLEVYDDYEQQILSSDDFVKILKFVESYVFRRSICGVPTNSLNKTFATISKDIDKANYLESTIVTFFSKESQRRFPKNEEFIQELVIKDIYNFRNRNYLLRKLENFNRKEIVDIESYTIEHIMPQNPNLSQQWRQDLGGQWEEVHKTYLHTLGNLTLTRYNSELSDRSFQNKRELEGGFADSPLRLNRGLGTLKSWNMDEIVKRAKRLAELALQVWEYPVISDEAWANYTSSKAVNGTAYSMADHAENLQGKILDIFGELRKRICNLDSSVREEFKKPYIAYKTTTNFVDIVPQTSKLRVILNLAFQEIDDPEGICLDVTDKGRVGNGDVEINVTSMDEIGYAMFLIKQSFEKHHME